MYIFVESLSLNRVSYFVIFRFHENNALSFLMSKILYFEENKRWRNETYTAFVLTTDNHLRLIFKKRVIAPLKDGHFQFILIILKNNAILRMKDDPLVL